MLSNHFSILKNIFSYFILFSLWLDELEVLVRGEESDELWHLDDLNVSGSVNIEVSPSLLEVGGHVSIELSTADGLVGAENLSTGGVCGSLVHPEFSSWLSTLVSGGLVLGSLLLKSVVLDHGSHEDVIIVGGEVSWHSWLSVVGAGTDHTRVSWLEVVTLEGNKALLLIIRGVAVRLGLSELSSRLVWWSGISLGGGVISVSSLDGRVGSVIVDGSKRPDWLASGGDTNEDGNSVGEFHDLIFRL